jgi:cytochrome P450
MNDTGRAIAYASRLYLQRANTAYAGYIHRDPMALLRLSPGRTDPYPIYDRIREGGTLVPTRLGNWVSPSHRVCDSVLRNRRFGVRLADTATSAEPDEFDLSFLEMNPPGHTRLRRLALPAFSPKAVAGYQDRITRTVGDLLGRASAAGEFDLVTGFAAPLPIAVITDLLGVPDADSREFARYGAVIASALDGITSLRHARRLQASDAALRRLFEQLFELRRRNTTTIRGPARLPVSTGARRRSATPAPRPVPAAGGAARALPESGWPAGRPPGRQGRSR